MSTNASFRAVKASNYLETSFGWLSPDGDFYKGTVIDMIFTFFPELLDRYDVSDNFLARAVEHLYMNGWVSIRLRQVYAGFENCRPSTGEQVPLPTLSQLNWLSSWEKANIDAFGDYVLETEEPHYFASAVIGRVYEEYERRQEGAGNNE